jgi:glutamate---cysteine ligase / carboxylate-amine ligase
MEHRFTGTPFTIGIEEELMLVDPETLDLAQGIEAILEDCGESLATSVKPELLQAVLEIATEPCATVAEAGAQLAELRGRVSQAAERNGMLLGAAGTHPTARWEEQLVVDRPRYRELIEDLGWIARQELIFGTHVHVGIPGADRAIYVADGLRRHIPLLLALSCNSPFWCGEDTGMMSARTPIFRHFPRVGIPPHYGSWEIYSGRVDLMVEAGAIEDYTYIWWDVRPHPNLGTVEIRVFDQQTLVEDTVALAALAISLAHRYVANFDAEKPLIEVPTELIDDNKVRAALRGLDGELVDFPRPRQAPTAEIARETIAEIASDAEELGCAKELAGLERLIAGGGEAKRQLAEHEKGGMEAVVRYITGHAAPPPAS